MATDVQDPVWRDGYAAGYQAALSAVSASTVELNDAWRAIGRKTHEEQVAARLELFEECASRFHAANGTRPWVVVDP